MELQTFLTDQSESLKTFPEQFLSCVAILVHESDKILPDLVKYIKGILVPLLSESQESETLGTSLLHPLSHKSRLNTFQWYFQW